MDNLCRICLKVGHIRILDQQIVLSSFVETGKPLLTVYVQDLFKVFHNYQHLLGGPFKSEDMICDACLIKLEETYDFYKQIKQSSEHRQQQEADIKIECEVEYLLDEFDIDNNNDKIDDNFLVHPNKSPKVIKTKHETYKMNKEVTPSRKPKRKTEKNKKISLDEKDCLIVSKFLPPTTQTSFSSVNENENVDDPDSSSATIPEIKTIDFAAFPVKCSKLNVLTEKISTQLNGKDNTLYACKYCPKAFTTPEFLEVHVRNTHVCKFCTTAFRKYQDLIEHIRTAHKNHKCAICGKIISNHSNLRAHLQRMHNIKLPPYMSLLGYKQEKASETKT